MPRLLPHCLGSAVLAALLVLAALQPGCASAQVTPRQAALIEAHMPREAPAEPAQPRRVLLYTRCTGFVHASIPHGVMAFTRMGERTGAYEAVHSEDPEMFDPANLTLFDAVVMLNTTGEPLATGDAARDEELRESFMQWLRAGGALVGVHAGSDCCYNWEEYGRALGGYFDGHPWNAGDLVHIKLDDPHHPVNASFRGMGFEILEEIYQFKDLFGPNDARLLASLDTARTDMSKDGIKRVDHHFPVSWVRRHGNGRVFYTSLGHCEDIYWNPLILGHYLAGLQWAMGDLEGDDTPTGMIRDADGFRPLFNGTDFAGWRTNRDAWVVMEGGVLAKGARRGYLWTDEQFGDFVLELEFMNAEGTNSGVFFRTGDIGDYVHTGIEAQILDSWGVEEPNREDAGAIFDVKAPRVNAVRAPGEWNHYRIEARGSNILVDLNGIRVIDMDLDEWTEAGRNPDGTPNKFRTAYRDMPRRGHIGLQDHGQVVWFRNVRIKELD